MTGRSRWWLVGLIVAMLAVGALLLVRQAALPGPPRVGPPASQAPGAGTGTGTGTQRDRAAARLFRALGRRLQHGSPAAVTALAARGDDRAVRQLSVLRRNVLGAHVVGLDLRLADPPRAGSTAAGGSGASTSGAGSWGAGSVAAVAPGTWDAEVVLRWRIAGFDTHDGSTDVSLRLRDLGGRVGFVSASARPGRAAPGWLLGPVTARRGSRWQVVVAAGQPVARLARLARRAVSDVDRVLPRWHGRLVVEVPADQADLDLVLGERPGTRAGTAAVTTTVDGSLRPEAPLHVFVNPDVVDGLGPRASQVVVSHEATHVATRAVFSSMPAWLVEGFADYVAFDRLDLPPSVPAADLVEQVRRDGPPARLPVRSDFDAAGPRAGASYEAAWLACRLIARTYGERRLVEFYRAADRASSTAGAFGSVLGTDQRAFTRAWRRELRSVAGVAVTTVPSGGPPSAGDLSPGSPSPGSPPSAPPPSAPPPSAPPPSAPPPSAPPPGDPSPDGSSTGASAGGLPVAGVR